MPTQLGLEIFMIMQDLTPCFSGFSSNRTGFDRMVKLTMTSFLPDLLPTI